MVYLLHFSSPYRHARHYVGYASGEEEFARRLREHRAGSGARLMQVVKEAGITFEVARVWPDAGRDFERYLKTRHKRVRALCPLCRAEGR